MHVVAIAWLFVTLLMAATERSAIQGVLTFVLYGVAPLALFWWVVGAPARRARNARRARAASAQAASVRAEDDPGAPDQQDPRRDQ